MEMYEIDAIVDKHKNNFVDNQNYMVHISDCHGVIPILMHTASSRVIGVAKSFLSIQSLLDHNTSERFSFGSPRQNTDFNVPNFKIWTVKYDRSKETWGVDLNFSGTEQIDYLIFMNQKLKLIDSINNTICNNQARLTHKLPYEQYMLIGKLDEINKIITNNIQEDSLNNYPLVSAYARDRNISLQDATKELSFQIKNDFTHLSELEYLRLKYSRIVREETDMSNFRTIEHDLMNELYGYSRFGVL